ncbi:AraC family transcriptional regulator [Spirillospora sp. NPDC049024]
MRGRRDGRRRPRRAARRVPRVQGRRPRRGRGGRSIAEIGARWGLPDAPGLSRAFRARYGMSPREHRRAALSMCDDPPRRPATSPF